MKDAIGQTVNVGDTIVHCGGHARAMIHTVIKITKHRIGYTLSEDMLSYVKPEAVINITSNLKALEK